MIPSCTSTTIWYPTKTSSVCATPTRSGAATWKWATWLTQSWTRTTVAAAAGRRPASIRSTVTPSTSSSYLISRRSTDTSIGGQWRSLSLRLRPRSYLSGSSQSRLALRWTHMTKPCGTNLLCWRSRNNRWGQTEWRRWLLLVTESTLRTELRLMRKVPLTGGATALTSGSVYIHLEFILISRRHREASLTTKTLRTTTIWTLSPKRVIHVCLLSPDTESALQVFLSDWSIYSEMKEALTWSYSVLASRTSSNQPSRRCHL